MRVDVKGLEEVIARMKARTERVQDLEPALQFFGDDIVTRADTNFRNQVNWDGSAFAPLKPATILNRVNAIKGANKYTASSVKKVKAAREAVKNATTEQKAVMRQKLIAAGWNGKQARAIINFAHAYEEDKSGKLKRVSRRLTKASDALRGQMLAPGGIQILIDTARARNSNHIDPPDKTSVMWSAVGYLAYHMSGTTRMEARNPTAFAWNGKKWDLADDANKDLKQAVTNYIYRGEPDQGAA